MRSVNIAELKNSLSAYLRLVRDGEEVVIRDRNRAIARIVPIEVAGDEEEEERQLVAAGLLRLGKGPIEDSFWDLPAPRVAGERVQQALQEDRDAW
jgi:prevent-host-death family protein